MPSLEEINSTKNIVRLLKYIPGRILFEIKERGCFCVVWENLGSQILELLYLLFDDIYLLFYNFFLECPN